MSDEAIPATTSGFTRAEPGVGPVITRADAIKALTHPLRIRLLNLFRPGTELTATECAELTGESVASCSFHLRQLEKYGHVERADTRGKERPWRAVSRGYAVRADEADPDSISAAQAFTSVWLTEQFTLLQQWAAEADRDDPSWVLASTQTSADFWATRDELDELSQQVEHLVARFATRSEDPQLRPAGARRSHLFGAVWADVQETHHKGGDGA